MAHLITEKELRQAIEDDTFLTGGSPNNCDAIKCDLTLGPLFLRSKFGRPVDYNHLSASEVADAVISPGESVFVMATERLNLPGDVFAQLSPKRKMTEAGIMTMGGFAIDPGYHGNLVFCLYNYSSKDFPLIPGKKLVAAVFYRLTEEEADIDRTPPPPPIDDFPQTLITMVKEFSPIGIDAVRCAVAQLQETVDGHTATINGLQFSAENLIRQVGQVDVQVGQLTEKLSEEVDYRRKGDDVLRDALAHEADRRVDGDKDVGELRGKVSSIKWTIGLSIAGVGVLLALVQIALHFFG